MENVSKHKSMRTACQQILSFQIMNVVVKHRIQVAESRRRIVEAGRTATTYMYIEVVKS